MLESKETLFALNVPHCHALKLAYSAESVSQGATLPLQGAAN